MLVNQLSSAHFRSVAHNSRPLTSPASSTCRNSVNRIEDAKEDGSGENELHDAMYPEEHSEALTLDEGAFDMEHCDEESEEVEEREVESGDIRLEESWLLRANCCKSIYTAEALLYSLDATECKASQF